MVDHFDKANSPLQGFGREQKEQQDHDGASETDRRTIAPVTAMLPSWKDEHCADTAQSDASKNNGFHQGLARSKDIGGIGFSGMR